MMLLASLSREASPVDIMLKRWISASRRCSVLLNEYLTHPSSNQSNCNSSRNSSSSSSNTHNHNHNHNRNHKLGGTNISRNCDRGLCRLYHRGLPTHPTQLLL